MSAAEFLDRVDLRSLPGDTVPRERAAGQLRDAGWPTRANEAWHYTDLNARLKGFDLVVPGLALPGGDNDSALASLMPALDQPTIVFVNGRYAAARSAQLAWLRRYGSDAVAADAPMSAMVALNAAIADDGVVLEIPKAVDAGTIVLVSVAQGQDGGEGDGHLAIAPRHRISLGAGASLTLIEIARGSGEYLHDPVVDIDLAAGAALRHYRLQDEAIGAVHVATIFAAIADGARYDQFILNTGARLSRNETHATLSGAAAEVHLNAAQLLTGTQHGDITTIVAHHAPHCASRQTVKSVLAGSSRGVFQGRIEVARVAQKTDGYQMNQALLLSPAAEIDSKPELEIFADDVKCSHGATIGALDPEQMFYLRSRGIPEAEARAMLIRAFLDEALEPVTDAAARTLFEHAIEVWWRRGVA